jgi:hypothetical protein
VIAAVVAVTLLATACSDDGNGGDDDSGAMTADAFAARRRAYLEAATRSLDAGSPLSALAHFERAALDPAFRFDPGVLTPRSFAGVFDKIDTFRDTADFDVLYLLNLWYAHADRLPPATREAIARRFRAFKYWYTEPTPKGVVDDRYYWSENHRIIFHVDEYLAGRAFPEARFTNDGRTGSEHAASAKEMILAWLDEKVRFGFSEWHSDVYYQKDVTPLLTLVEFAPDDDVANRAAMVLDLVLLDIALHLQRGNFGATHGRSYMKDKSTAVDQDTFALAKLLFDDTTLPYREGTDAGAVLFARARKYVLPPVIRAIARYDEPMVDRERMNVPLDPAAPVTADPAPPYGISYDDPANVPFWWERGAQTAWQVVPLTIRTLDEHGLWDNQFYAPFKPLRALVGDDMARARSHARSLAPVLGFGLLSEVHTYTYRARDVMLSTAQDYRPGVFGEQYHAWQATLDEQAVVFTTHPKNEPERATEWPDRDGYWTGTGSMPRSAQFRTAAIHIYAPEFEPYPPPLDAFSYLDYTHAYFPRERFDEVVREGHWTFGRRGDGYVALWSQREPEWREYEPTESVFTNGLVEPFDLVARGGADNVWVVEVGDAPRWRSFEEFRAAVTAAPVEVDRDRNVSYTSPGAGRLTFGWNAPLRVDGSEVALHPPARMDNPFVQVPFEGRRYEVRLGDDALVLDFAAWSRRIDQ